MSGLQIWLVFWPGFFLGMLHTLIPCEDKTIFFFYTLGISKSFKQAFKILMSYGLGLLLSNLTLGVFASIGGIIFKNFNQNINNGLGAVVTIIAGLIMFIQIKLKKFNPHSQQGLEIMDTIQDGKIFSRKKTPLLLGILAGIPPCIFEIAIYSQAMTFSASSGVINGIAVVFFFGIGTWIGLFPYAAFGLLGPFAKYHIAKSKISLKSYTNKDIEKRDKNELNEKRISLGIEYFSSISLIVLGIILLILAILKINVFKWPPIPQI